MRSAGFRLTLCLLPVVAASAPTSVAPGTTPEIASRPYLAVLGPPPLRFAEAIPPPDLSARPAIGAPPNPTGDSNAPTSGSVAAVAATESPVLSSADTSSSLSPQAKSANGDASAAAPVDKTPAPILADDARPRVKTEDFLPFFVYPGSNGAPQVIVPAEAPAAPVPGTLPPSSATYRQQ